jgi:nicotinamide mononucleotide transporter
MEILDWIFAQYAGYSTTTIVIELSAVVASVISVLYSKKNSVLVFPFGIISTLLFVYLLYFWNLLGDMLINAYYFIMSAYGWYVWSQENDQGQPTPITRTSKNEWLTSSLIALSSGTLVYFIYSVSERLESTVSYVDMLTTGIFFSGMWLMARRKIEHWLVLLVGNVISIPLYIYKGAGFTALLYIFLAIIAYVGYRQWQKYLNRSSLTASA